MNHRGSRCRFHRALLLAVLLGLLSSGFVCADQSLPESDVFTDYVVRILETYPTDGTNAYWWPKQSQWQGVTRDIYYNGQVVAEGDPKGRCFCCGLTWEVFMRAIEEYNKERDPDVFDQWTTQQVDLLRRQWFGSDGNRECLHNAVLINQIGFEITDPEQVRRGDFIQLWRYNGSGHSVIFDKWIRNDQGEIVKLRYWSTQPKTGGIGYAEEVFGNDSKGIKADETYFVRIGKRPEEAKTKCEELPAAAD